METIIEDYGYDGEGVGKVNGKICFIPYVIKGEKVRFKIVKDKSKFCIGELVEILTKSPKRIEARCPYFAKCGGCSYQQISYEEEILIKEQLYKKQLAKVGFKGEINVFKSPSAYRYRNKLKLFVNGDKIGFKYRGTDKICTIDDCLICKDMIGKAIKPIQDFISGNNLFNCIELIVMRQEGNECLINFVLNKDRKINYQGLFLLLGQNYGIYQTYNNKSLHIYGIKYLKKYEFGLMCKFYPSSFHQVNEEVCQKLYQEILDSIVGSVINCYSGNGVLSAIISQQTSVTGVEIGEIEHQEAEELKNANKLINMINIKGDCAKVLPTLNGDTIIVDPPRAGLDKKVCEVISKKNCKRLIYVSCNSATLVRDVKLLNNYRIEKVYLFDMFARTGEYECMIIFNNDKNI